MTIKECDPKEMKFFSVKIVCDDGHESKLGTGTIIENNDVYYVISTAHTITKIDNKTFFAQNEIKIYTVAAFGPEQELQLLSILSIVSKEDKLMMKIGNPNNNFKYSERVKRTHFAGMKDCYIYGYTEYKPKGRLFPITLNDDNTIQLNENLFSNVCEEPKNLVGGCSGAGVFFRVDDVYYHIGYVKALLTEGGAYNEITFISTSLFDHDLSDDSYDDSLVFESLLSESKQSEASQVINYFQCINDSLLRDQRFNTPCLFDPYLNKIHKQVIDPTISTMFIVALSGIGKTRLIYDAFNTGDRYENVLYCRYSKDSPNFIYQVCDILLDKNREDGGLLIVDECPFDLFMRITEDRDSYNKAWKIIGINNDYYKVPKGFPHELIKISPNQLRDMVDKYIDDHTQTDENKISDKEQIKKMADGFPSMAIDLVAAYNDKKGYDVHSVQHLIPKMLNLNAPGDKDQLTAMETLALFYPVPYKEQYRAIYEFIFSNEKITPLYSKSFDEKRNIFDSVIQDRKDTQIDILSNLLYVRPLPLAIWLVEEWFEHCDEDRLTEMSEAILKEQEPITSELIKGLKHRIEYMQESKKAQLLIGRLTIPHKGPFGKEKVVCSDLGSQLFLAFAVVNPVAVANCLNQLFREKSIEWIQTNVCEASRRNLVNTLERLCFDTAAFRNAIEVLALFSLAENEYWSNNSTGQLKQLFHIHLAGTEVNLEERFSVIQDFMKKGGNYRTLALDLIDQAFMNGGFSRASGAEKYGLQRKEDYWPSSKEITWYWNACKDLLLEWLDKDKSILERVARIVKSQSFGWAADGLADILFPLLEKVAQLKNNDWEDMYDNMHRHDKFFTKKNSPILPKWEEWEAKLHPLTFASKLKDARLKLYEDYHMSSEESLQLSSSLFGPLAEEFVNQKVYASKEQVQAMLDDKDYYDNTFTRSVLNHLSTDELTCFKDVILSVLSEKNTDYKSSYLLQFCYYYSRRFNDIADFFQFIYNLGYQALYVSLWANVEDRNLTSYQHLRGDSQKGRLDVSILGIYLQYIPYETKNEFPAIIKNIQQDYPDCKYKLMEFILRHRYGLPDEIECEALPFIKKEILSYPITEHFGNLNQDYTSYVIDLLKKRHDEQFAADLNRKLLEELNQGYFHYYFKGIFSILITQYTEIIWDDFFHAFLSDDHGALYFQIRYELGSGSGFGTGPLFRLDENKLKQLCNSHPESAPARFAEMIPVYKYDDHQTESFSDWFIWLLDNFSDRPHVLSSLNGNIGTFSWSGSIIPYYVQNILCFRQLLDHRLPQVREWAQKNIQQFEAEKQIEEERESYMNFRYS